MESKLIKIIYEELQKIRDDYIDEWNIKLEEGI